MWVCSRSIPSSPRKLSLSLPLCSAMDVLSISSPSHSYIPSLRLHHSSRPKPSFYIPISSSPKPSITKCFQATASPTPTPSSKSHTFLDSSVLSSAPQTPATAMRGAEADAMGLLLRERIVFLGSSIDDFVADAIISQLLLLDAQDSTKDIKLFINSVGGSLRLNKALAFSGSLFIFNL